MILKEKITKIRLDNNLSKEQFANDLFVTVIDVEKWEEGYSIPDDEILHKISTLYNVNFDELNDKYSNNNRIAIGYRSSKHIAFSLLTIFIFMPVMFYIFVMAINESDDNYYFIFFILLFAGVFIYYIYLLLKTLRLPKVVIEKDDKGIYLKHLKDLFIPYDEIVGCYAKKAKAKNVTYSYGHVFIITNNNKYKIGILKDVDGIINVIKDERYNYKRK